MSVALEKSTRQSVGMGQIMIAQAGELSAILGSCIGLLMYHPRSKMTALAHIVLPDAAERDGPPGKYADSAVPRMFSLFRAQGHASASLVIKLAGGASMFGPPGPLQIGLSNADAVKRHLAAAGVSIAGEHLGGNKGRRITANTNTGELLIEIVGQPSVVI